MKPKKLPYNVFKKIYSTVPRLCVDLIVQTQNGILLTKREITPYIGYWHTPGGTVLLHEKINDAIQRVAKEEIGTKVKIIKLLGIMEYPKYEKTLHTISIGYLVNPISSKLKGSNQAKELRFFKELPLKTINVQRKFILAQNILGK